MGKRRNSGGFTMVETLVSLAILVMLISIVSLAVSTAMKAYESVTFTSESDLLSSTVHTALADILRYAVCSGAENTSEGDVSITNESYGISKGSLFLKDGRIMVNPGGADPDEPFFLVNNGAYTSMKITDFEMKYEDGLFSGRYVIQSNSGKFEKTKEFAFRTLKAK